MPSRNDPRTGTKQNIALRVVDQLRLEIRNGWPVARKFDEYTLMRELNVSRSSLRQALNQLSDEGLVTRTPSRGTVLHSPVTGIDLFLRDQAEVRSRQISTHPYQSSPIMMSLFGLEHPSMLVRDEYILQVRGATAGVRTTHTMIDPATAESRMAESADEHSLSLIAQVADADLASLLELAPSASVLTQEEVTRSPGGQVVAISFTHWRVDRIALVASEVVSRDTGK